MNKKVGLAGGLVLAAIAAWLAFGIFGIQTLFVDNTVDEANPFASAVVASDVDDVETEPTNDSPALVDEETTVDEPASDAAPEAAAEPVQDAVEAETPAAEPEIAETETADADTAPEIVTLATGFIVDHDHSGDGTVNVITDGNVRFLRFEDDFAVDNGPDLNVYLSRGAPADGDPGLFDDDFIDLGDLKGNIGAQNYELPSDVDITEYNTVVIWCVRFGVAFNAADLA